jgi:RNA polymerase sigma-70 factor (ECF subfamily)
MKLSYNFATGEKSEIEIAEEWAAVVLELDRLDYNADQRETRRHCSLEAFNLDDALFPSDADVLGDIIRSERHGALFAAISTLSPSQQELVHQVYFEGKKLVEIAREQGVSHVAVHDRLNRIHKKLKKILEYPLTFCPCRDLPVKAPTNRLRKGRSRQMNHTLRIGVSKERLPGIGIVSCRRITVRERLLRLFLGDQRMLTVIVPGNSVKTVSIHEEGGDQNGQTE